MDEIPPDVQARRDGIYEKVTRAGRTRRRRRAFALVTVVAAVVAIPVAAVAVNSSKGSGPRVVASATTTSSTTVPTPTTPSTSAAVTTSSAPLPTTVETPLTGPVSSTSTTALACHNSENPACGPLHYVPAITNEPAHLTVVSVSPTVPKAGEKVTVTLRSTDPDSRIDRAGIWCNDGGYTFGDGESTGCAASCVSLGFGTWDPPAPHPGNLVISIDHAYAKAGTYEAKFTASGDVCGPRPSSASVSVVIGVSP